MSSTRSHTRATPRTTQRTLTRRESDILRLVVKSFIDTAGPIGSRFLAKRYPLGLSAASIRNTMSDLEELGYLDHPYTSAGRVPTDLGYRTFVDKLMKTPGLSARDRGMIKREIEQLRGATEELSRESSRLLGRLSNLLGVVLTPRLSTGVLDRLEVVPLSSARVMFVISLRGGLFKTIVLELDAVLKRSMLDDVVDLLNERLTGLTLEEIRRTYEVRIQDLRDERTGLVRLVLQESASLFSEPSDSRLSYAGAQYMLALPEFQEPDGLKHLIEMLEDDNFIVQLLEDQPVETGEAGRAFVRIGRENMLNMPSGGRTDQIERFSIVTAPYRLGDTTGTVGVIGPTRMDYTRVIALVEGLAAVLSLSATTAES